VELSTQFAAEVASQIPLADFLTHFAAPRPMREVQRALLEDARLQGGKGEADGAQGLFGRMLLFALRHDLLEPLHTYIFQRPAPVDVRRPLGPKSFCAVRPLTLRKCFAMS